MRFVSEEDALFEQTKAALAAAAAVVIFAAPAQAQVTTGIALFEQHCGACHNSKEPGNRAPDRLALSQRSPESILEAMTTGVMTANASKLTPVQKRIVAEQLALRPIGSSAGGSVETMTN